MSVAQADPRGEELSRMISSLRLKEVRQTAIESRRLGDPPAGLNGQTKLEWRHTFGKEIRSKPPKR